MATTMDFIPVFPQEDDEDDEDDKDDEDDDDDDIVVEVIASGKNKNHRHHDYYYHHDKVLMIMLVLGTLTIVFTIFFHNLHNVTNIITNGTSYSTSTEEYGGGDGRIRLKHSKTTKQTKNSKDSAATKNSKVIGMKDATGKGTKTALSASFSYVAALPTDFSLDDIGESELKPLIVPSKQYLFQL
jgi:hypothetical protein